MVDCWGHQSSLPSVCLQLQSQLIGQFTFQVTAQFDWSQSTEVGHFRCLGLLVLLEAWRRLEAHRFGVCFDSLRTVRPSRTAGSHTGRPAIHDP